MHCSTMANARIVGISASKRRGGVPFVGCSSRPNHTQLAGGARAHVNLPSPSPSPYTHTRTHPHPHTHQCIKQRRGTLDGLQQELSQAVKVQALPIGLRLKVAAHNLHKGMHSTERGPVIRQQLRKVHRQHSSFESMWWVLQMFVLRQCLPFSSSV